MHNNAIKFVTATKDVASTGRPCQGAVYGWR